MSCRLLLRKQNERADVPGQLSDLRQDILCLEAELRAETNAAVQQISGTVPHGHLGAGSTILHEHSWLAAQHVDYLS